MSVKLSLKNIEGYYFQRTISQGVILKNILKDYKNNHKEFPENLEGLYEKFSAPRYAIGLVKYQFGYHKADSSYRLYFNHFGGRMFTNYGEGNVWNFYD